MNVKCDCGCKLFVKLFELDINPKYHKTGSDVFAYETTGAIMCANCKKVYTKPELEAEKSANVCSKEFVLSKWYE